jgi:integrase
MQRAKTRTNVLNTRPKAEKFNKVLDEKKKRVRGLWERKDSYYAQLDANNGKQYKYPLHGAETVPQAITETQVLKKLQREGKLLPPTELRLGKKEDQKQYTNGHLLKEAIAEYKKHRQEMKAGDEKTWAREDSGLARWEKKFGDLELSVLDDSKRTEYAKWRQAEGDEGGGEVSGRTVDIDIGTLQKVIDCAVRDLKWLTSSPFSKWKKLDRGPSREVRLIETAEIHELTKAAIIDEEALTLFKPEYRQALHRAEQAFSDYLYLLAYSGGREKETIRQRWPNTNWKRKVLLFPGKEAKAGGGRPALDRDVDFNKKLAAHLKAMYKRRNQNSVWMFPNPDDPGKPMGSFRKQLERVKRVTKLLDIGFHHFRHYFISHCVMAQPWIDYMTIAIWVSHRDKGILIAKKYGHLRPGHTARMAKHLDRAFEF